MEQRGGERRREGGRGENMNGHSGEKVRGERWHRKKEKRMEGGREGQRETASILYHVNKNQPTDQVFRTMNIFCPQN